MSERRSNAVKVLAKIGNAPSAAWLDEFVIDAEDSSSRAGTGLVGPHATSLGRRYLPRTSCWWRVEMARHFVVANASSCTSCPGSRIRDGSN